MVDQQKILKVSEISVSFSDTFMVEKFQPKKIEVTYKADCKGFNKTKAEELLFNEAKKFVESKKTEIIKNIEQFNTTVK